MVNELFEVVAETIGHVITNLGTALTGVTALFWDGTNNQLTILGILAAVTVGGSVVYFVFRLIRGLIAGGARAQM